MPPPTSRRKIERPPNKIAAIVYLLIGFMALGVAAFVLLYQKSVAGPTSNAWIGFGIVIALYGVFRIYTGVSTLRKAANMNNSHPMNGQSSESKLPLS